MILNRLVLPMSLLAMVGMAACGPFYELNFTSVNAVREADDHVTATADMICHLSGVESCSHSGDGLCVRAEWYPAAAVKRDAGTNGGESSYDSSQLIDQVRTCQQTVLKHKQAATFVMSSNVVIPKASTVIRVIVETTQGGTPEDHERAIPSP